MRWSLVVLVGGFWAAAAGAEPPLAGFPVDYEPQVAPTAVDSIDRLIVRVYPVADLVVHPRRADDVPKPFDVESSPLAPGGVVPVATASQSSMTNLAELSVILQAVIAPGSWEMTGGEGHVTVHGNTFSLIVRQTESVHDEIAELLTRLRRENDVAIEATIQFYTEASPEPEPEPDDPAPSLMEIAHEFRGPLTAEAVAQLKEALRGRARLAACEQLLLQNGWGTRLGGGIGTVTGVISPDRRSIRLQLELQIDESGSTATLPCRIPDGNAQVLSFVFQDEAMIAVVTARIVVPDEEEELLPMDPASDDPRGATTDIAADPTAPQAALPGAAVE